MQLDSETHIGFVASWIDEDGIPRAWGSADDQITAETQADIQRDEYERERIGFPVRLATRKTAECIADAATGNILIAVDVAEVSR